MDVEKSLLPPCLHLTFTYLEIVPAFLPVQLFSRLFLCSALQQQGVLAGVQALITLPHTENVGNSKKEGLAQAEIIVCIMLNFMSGPEGSLLHDFLLHSSQKSSKCIY